MSAQLIAAQADLNFLHSDSVQLTDPMTALQAYCACLLYTSPSPRDQRGSRMPSSA